MFNRLCDSGQVILQVFSVIKKKKSNCKKDYLSRILIRIVLGNVGRGRIKEQPFPMAEMVMLNLSLEKAKESREMRT